MLDSSATIELFAGFLKVRDVLCALRFVRVVDCSMADVTNALCCAWVAVVSDA